MIITLFALVCALMAIRTPGVNRLAFFYLLIMAIVTLWSVHYQEHQEAYGAWWFAVCAAAEIAIIYSAATVRCDASKWLMWSSAYNLAIHAGAVLSGAIPAIGLFYDLWNELLLVGEASQVLALLVFSRPIFVPLKSWYDYRKSRKGKATWLAKSTQAG